MKRLDSIRYLLIFTFCFVSFPFSAIAQAQGLKSEFSVLEEINAYNNSLGAEISKILEYQRPITGNQLMALNRLSNLLKNNTSQKIHTLESFLQIGLPAKRAYCSPIQAVLWILEKENDAQVFDYSLEQLLDKAWIFTESNRWNDYEVITDRLNAPELVNYYQRIRFIYMSKKGRSDAFKGDPRNLFTTNIGNCADHATFSAFCLKKGGYSASVKEVHPSGRGHLACLYKVDGGKYILDNGRPDKFLRRGVVPATEYKMYHDQINLKKVESNDMDRIYKLQDNYGLLLVYLFEHGGKAPNIKTICKDLGLSGYEKYVKKKYIKALISEGFISNYNSNNSGLKYTLNTSLCENFVSARYHKPKNASSSW